MTVNVKNSKAKVLIKFIRLIVNDNKIIYHDFLPTPRKGSHVKSVKHTHSHQDTPLSPYT